MLALSISKSVRCVSHPVSSILLGRVQNKSGATNKLLFRQLFEKESSTYTYLLADSSTNDAVLIDPVLETCGRFVFECLCCLFQ